MSTVAVDPVTARWAGALWNLASSEGAVDQVGQDLERLAAEFSSPAVRAFMLAGDASPAERRAKLEQVMGGFHELSRRFVGLALDRARMGVLERAHAAYRTLSLEKAGVVEGVVEAARPLEAAEVSAEMSGGGRRVVVVAEVPHEGAVAPMRDVASVHVDTEDGADPDDELAWFATQEIPHLLE